MKSLSFYPRLIIFSIVAIISTFSSVYAASVIKGTVTDNKNRPMVSATASLTNVQTKTLVQSAICDANGNFKFENMNEGRYVLTVSMIGYKKSETEIVVEQQDKGYIEKKIIMNETTKQLTAVEVVGKKNFVEQSVDRVVINPEASITSASENVYEILKKSPGVTFDNNDRISLKGKEGIKVLIDDKPTYIGDDQLVTLLKSMQGKNIDRIEIIENPPARYDAEGNAGIINIKTKHNKAPGFNGSVNGGLTYNSFIGGNGGLDLNLKAGKVNLYGNYSIYDWRGWNGQTGYRGFSQGSFAGGNQTFDTHTDYNGLSHNYKFGADFYLSKNQVLSVMTRGNFGSNKVDEINSTWFHDKNQVLDSTLKTITDRNMNWNGTTYNLNYKWDIDTLGTSLVADADYAQFGFISDSEQDSKYYDINDNPLNKSINIKTNQGGDISIWSGKMDFVHPFLKNYTLEAGAKASYVSIDPSLTMSGTINQVDNFVYTEYIQAAYASVRAQYKKLSLQAGLRLENTISEGKSITLNQVNDTSYLKLFPSVFAQYKISTNQTLSARYSYRITRPQYRLLNPFRWYQDPYTVFEGNPYLGPQLTHSMSLSHDFKSMFMTSVGYNYTTNLIGQVITQNDNNRTIYETMQNMSFSNDVNISETVQLKIFDWWNLNGTLTGMYKEVRANIGGNVEFKQPGFSSNIMNSIQLPYKIGMELSGNYYSKQLYGNIVIKPRYSIDLGFQKKVLKDKGVIKISVNDIFKTSMSGAYSKYNNVDIDVNNVGDSRRFNLTFSYRFGKDEFKTRANRSTSSSEEQSRSGNN